MNIQGGRIGLTQIVLTSVLAAGLLSAPMQAAARTTAKPAATAPSAAVAEGRRVMAGLMAAEPLPALSVAVVRHDKLVWAQAWGMADLEARTPATTSNLFRLGSVSKIVTASLTARLAERGVVDLDAPISTYLPDLPAQHRATTLRQLLGQLGGVRHYIDRDEDRKAPGGPIGFHVYPTTKDALAVFIDDPLVAPPGQKYSYSTFGYTLISAVLEAAAKRPFLDLVRDEVSVPLGLNTLQADAAFTLLPGRVRFYDKGEEYRTIDPTISGAVVNAAPMNPAYKWAGGGFVATPSDMAQFGAAHVRPGYIGAAMFRQVFTSQVAADGKPTGVGLGWRVDTDGKGRRRYSHGGSQEGARAVVVVYPDLDLSIAFNTNLGSTPRDVLTPAEKIADAFGR